MTSQQKKHLRSCSAEIHVACPHSRHEQVVRQINLLNLNQARHKLGASSASTIAHSLGRTQESGMATAASLAADSGDSLGWNIGAGLGRHSLGQQAQPKALWFEKLRAKAM